MENNFLGSRSGFPHKGVFLTKVIKASIVAFIKTKILRPVKAQIAKIKLFYQIVGQKEHKTSWRFQ